MATDGLRQDVRFALRTLRREPGFFAAAVLIIGLGIGATTAVFSVVNSVLFQPLRFRASDRLVWIANNGGGGGGLSSVTTRVSNYLDWRRMSGGSFGARAQRNRCRSEIIRGLRRNLPTR